jgi:hypothetical protein
MSRGPGRWQRPILRAVQDGGDLLVNVVEREVGRAASPSEYSACNRAAHTLERARHIQVVRCWARNAVGRVDALAFVAAPDTDGAALGLFVALIGPISVEALPRGTESTVRAGTVV